MVSAYFILYIGYILLVELLHSLRYCFIDSVIVWTFSLLYYWSWNVFQVFRFCIEPPHCKSSIKHHTLPDPLLLLSYCSIGFAKAYYYHASQKQRYRKPISLIGTRRARQDINHCWIHKNTTKNRWMLIIFNLKITKNAFFCKNAWKDVFIRHFVMDRWILKKYFDLKVLSSEI